MAKSKSQLRREAIQRGEPMPDLSEAEHGDTAAAPETASEPAAPAAQPTMRLRLLQNHFVAGELKLKGDTVELPTAVAEKELRVTRGVYESA